jgi:1-acyl-sn-glycerol-3-phosphate acyltransferase
MTALRWKLVNAGQALFLAFWSMLWMSAAVVARIVTGDETTGLKMARRIWAPGILFVGGARVVISGHEQIDFSRPHVFVMNHESMIDIPAAQAVLPVDLRFITKRELLNVPFLGWYIRAVGMILVDRKDSAAAVQSLQAAGKRIREGASIIAFPEGTRSRDGKLLPFKKGPFVTAIEAGVPVVPMAIAGAREALPPDGFRVRGGVLRIVVGEPIPTADMTAADRDRLVALAQARVVALHKAAGGVGALSEEAVRAGHASAPA